MVNSSCKATRRHSAAYWQPFPSPLECGPDHDSTKSAGHAIGPESPLKAGKGVSTMQKTTLCTLAFVVILTFSAGHLYPADKRGGEGTHRSGGTKAAPKQKAAPKERVGPKQKTNTVKDKKSPTTRSLDKKKTSSDPHKGKAALTGPGTHKPTGTPRHGTHAPLIPHHGVAPHPGLGAGGRQLTQGNVQGIRGSHNLVQPTDPARLHRIANNARTRFAPNHRNSFTPQWWKNRAMSRGAHVGWYPHWWSHHNPYYWWRNANWSALTGWLPGVAWTSPLVYEYGRQLYYGTDGVYVNGTRQYSTDQYYQLVRNIAQTQPPGVSEASEWLPMGVFALQRPDASSPHAMVQLAVSKEGAVAGTSHDVATNTTLPIQGSVDKQTQRVAWMTTADDKKPMVAETWAKNLTQPESEVLVHFGPNKPEKWFMVRLDAPASAATTRLWNPRPSM